MRASGVQPLLIEDGVPPPRVVLETVI